MRYSIDRRFFFIGTVFLALFFFWSEVVGRGLLRPLDLMVAENFHDRMPEFLAWFFGLVCRTGNVEFSLPIWAWILYVILRRKENPLDHRKLTALLLTGFFLAGSVMEHVMKRVLFQPLPFLGRDPLDRYLHPIISVKTPYSYPSGHTLRAFMLLSLISIWLQGDQESRIKFVFFAVWASIIAIGVNAIGWHWSSDVIGSLLFVGGAHFLSRAVFRKKSSRPSM